MNEIRSKLEDALSQGINDSALAKAKNQLDDLFDDLYAAFGDYVKDNLPYDLAQFTQRMADEAVTAILKGDDAEMRRRLHCDEGYTGRDRDHPVIHGRLFETGAIELRKQIVEAHAQLLKNERILDLEDQVKSLVEQVNKAEARAEDIARRL